MDKCMQKGAKAASAGFFKKPDWALAASHYGEAAAYFREVDPNQAVIAYECLSEAHSKSDGIYQAGKALESKAFILAQKLNKPQEAADAYQRASNYFSAHGNIDTAANQLKNAGSVLEKVDVNASCDMYSKACALYQQEDNKGSSAIDIYKKAISLLIRSKKYDKAIDMLNQESDILRNLTDKSQLYKHQLYKANLSILILLFAIGDDVEADKRFSKMCKNDAEFLQSEEAYIAKDLLEAYETRDQELLVKTSRLQHVTFLNNDIVKLIRTLSVPGEVLSPTGSNRHEINSNNDSIRPPSQFKGAAADNNVRGMSHAQARAELYSRSGPPPSATEDLNKGFSNMRVQDDTDDEEELR